MTNNNPKHQGASASHSEPALASQTSIFSQFFLKSTNSHVTESFQSLLKSENFARDLQEFSSRLVPDMLVLLRKNQIANPEKLLLQHVETQAASLDQLAREQAHSSAPTLSKECKNALFISLALERLHLTEEVTSLKAKMRGGEEDSASIDIWEKRQVKAMRKLRASLMSSLQSLQLHFDIKASMAEDEEAPCQQLAAISKQLAASAYDYDSFNNFVMKVVIEPYGARLFQQIQELARDLDLSEELMAALQKKCPSSQQRKNLRKPTTPSKILKPGSSPSVTKVKTYETKEIQTEMVPLQELSSTSVDGVSSLAPPSLLNKRKSSQMSQEMSVMSFGGKTPQTTNTVAQLLGNRRNKRLLIQNSDQVGGTVSNQIGLQQSVKSSARPLQINSESGGSQEDRIGAHVRQARDPNSNESHAEVGLNDIMSSFPSCGSHSISNSLAKRPLEQVGNNNSIQKTHSSMGFSETAAIKQAQQRNSTGPGGFFSQRTASFDQGAIKRGGVKNTDEPSRSFQLKKTGTNHRRIFERAMTQSRTKKPKQVGSTRIVSINSVPGSALSTVNLGKKTCSSQQSGVLNSFLRNRQQKQSAVPVNSNILSQTTRHSRSINAVPSSQHSAFNQKPMLGLTSANAASPSLATTKQSSGRKQELTQQESAKMTDMDLLGLLPILEPPQDH